ncbi:hypothetical protein EDB84DRAFT_1678143 [Lactarius hengduanensis]|nr:hypothetical protein EDB84DRAFT_1678143 [Lactarius hengduanensis]
MAFHTLRPIRNIYIALHRDTPSAPTKFSAATGDQDDILRRPSSYPSCNLNANGHIHNESASTILARTVLRDDTAQPPASLASPDAPSPMPAPRVDEILTDVLPPDDNVYGPGSFDPALQTALRAPAAPPDLVITRVIQGSLDTSTTTIPFPTVEPAAPAPPPTPLASTFPGGFVVPYIVDRRTSSGILNVPLPPSTPVLNNMPPTGSHSLLLVPASPSLSRLQPSSTPDLDAAIEGEGGTKAALHKESDALDTPSAILENVMTTPDLPPLFPSPSVTDAAVAGPSWHPLEAEHTGHHPPHPSHDQYDIV